jgi:peroxiredoxin
MTLREQLEQQKAGFLAKVPAEVQTAIFRLVNEQQQSGIVFGLKEGDRAPNFSLTNSLGEQLELYRELAATPVVLVFYRGGWCPYCNIQLRAYQQMLPDIRKLGCQLIAVSPQSPDNSLSQQEKENLAYQVLSDPHGRVAASYNLLFELPDYLQQTYQHVLKLDLLAYNQTDRWVLPVPATYVVDKTATVRRAYVNPDFMRRMEPEEIIDQLRNM